MEVKTGRLIAQGVLNIDDDLVAFCCYNGRYRPFSVDANHGTCLLAIRIRVRPSYVEVVCDGSAASYTNQKRQWQQVTRQ